ncbi:hypothetical protein [Cryobacterium sp. TMT2-14]|uniref:hypothetical protein n=1 Tax=Cryobacterium sp. TMT2-14 TaxID=1259245 RepID=UPI0010693C26|nr:hypothetical protein [Cryobacterium sp. TMT2-14]TFC39057.1 hypothetical protein E3O28_04335 [Cryobacterium sp. TMT2-14]
MMALLLFAKNRSEIRLAVRELFGAFFNWKILVVVAVYLLYATGCVALAAHLDLWGVGILKDTLITIFFVGLPLIVSAPKVKSGVKLVRSVGWETIGLSGFLAFYVALASFSIPGELFLQSVLVVLAMLSVYGKRAPETHKLARGCDVLLSLIGIGLAAFTTYTLVSSWDALSIRDIALSLALSIWLPLMLLPLIIALAILMSAETVLSLLSWHNNKVEPPRRVRLAFLMGIHFSTFYAAHFAGQWLGRLARQKTFRGAQQVMRDYRRAIRRNVNAEKDRLERLLTMSGVAGTDENGLRRDRREFAATKKVLKHLFYMQMGWHRNRLGHFKSDMLELLGDVTKDGLPLKHGIELRVRSDSQAWYAWRETPSGWFFGVGGDGNLAIEWQYEGVEPPACFPTEGAGWTDVTSNSSRPEWAANDAPVRVV